MEARVARIVIGRGSSATKPPDISEFQALQNLEVLDLTACGYYGTLQMKENAYTLRKLKILNLGRNQFNESIVTSLSALSSLKTLDLQRNSLSGSFPYQELSKLSILEKLDLSSNYNLNITPSIEGCKSLMRLERLEKISLTYTNFNKSILSCLSFLPSLNILDLSGSQELGSSFPMKGTTIMSNLLHLNLDGNDFLLVDDIMRSMAAFPSLRFLSLKFCRMGGRLFANEVPNLPYLEVLLLSENEFNGSLPMEALTSFHHLEVLDISYNSFVGSIPSTNKSLSSLKVISFANNKLNGSLTDVIGLCELKNLYELDLSYNMFDGNLPECLNKLSSLKFFDISSNQFTGTILPPLIANLTSLVYVDFSHNKFEGSFSFSSFSNHTKLEFFQFKRDNAKIEMETEEPVGWIPKFQLKLLVISDWNIKRLPGFLLHQHKLRVLDMSHNSLEGQFPTWLLKNNTNLEVVKLSNNSFCGVIHMGYENAKIRDLDVSGNHITGIIPKDIQKFIPFIEYFNFSRNALKGVIPSSMADLSHLQMLDLSGNEFTGEVPKGFFTHLSNLIVIKLSNNKLHGHVLSGNFSLGNIEMLHLDNNCFTGNIGIINTTRSNSPSRFTLDISDNFFTGRIPGWISNLDANVELLVRNNNFIGEFPCGKAYFSFLDISQNSFSGSIPPCLNYQYIEHLHLGSNRFTGLIPDAFRNLTNVLTLDISHNNVFGRITEFLGELSNLRILLLGKNNFIGSIPKGLCQLNTVSLIDLSGNSLSGLIPRCLQNITRPGNLAFIQEVEEAYPIYVSMYTSVLQHTYSIPAFARASTRDEAQFTTKNNFHTYKGNMLDYMSGLDLSCNKLIGEIPQELGMLTQIHVLNLSHNQLIGPIPMNFSNLANIESLDLSSISLTGKVPSELIKLTYLEVFDVSHNNLSGRLPDLKAQFATFTSESYEGNPLLCGPPLEKKCTNVPHKTNSSTGEGTEEWYGIDKASFYVSFGSTWFVFMLGFIALLYINSYWCRRWLNFVEECMYICFYFLYDFVRNLCMLFHE
ncbi:hypothetical protein L1987_47959 [Smallanthus sonchifolius]|uniref:Uncharacterized protein n=1 Tax=Smallanthus sonchifolius TaxID=185202 RepID=A0ACB9FQN1_9ASTR|nr:hypothetical protein L1987_47959 [Smallanthus sonchifolius]